MRAGLVVLGGDDFMRLRDGMTEINNLASAISGLHGMVETIANLGGRAPCEECDDLHERVVNGYMMGSLNTAIGALADLICTKGELLEKLVEDKMAEAWQA